MLNEPNDALLDSLRTVVGDGWGEADEAHLTELRRLYRGQASILLKPGSTAEVAEIVRLCAEARVGIVPWGGGTGLVGGQVKPEPPLPVLLSLERMRRLRAVSPEQNTMTVEAGLPVQQVQEAAADVDRLFPLSYGSEGTASIGGGLAVNSGGLQALRYGVARDVCLGLEVVTAEGQVWHGLSTVKKDNTGYDLRDLYIGSEGTLGIITAAVLRLWPRPRSKAVAWASVSDPAAAIDLLNATQAASGGAVSVFELMAGIAVDFGLEHLPAARLPVGAPAEWHILTELWGSDSEALEAALTETLGAALEEGGVLDATIAMSEGQALEFRALREGLSDAQVKQGGSIKHDISVPIAAVPDFLVRAGEAVTTAIPGARPVPFGHLGDGNLHYNVSQPVGADRDGFIARWDEINHLVHDIVVDLGGSISAEHGIGRLKRASLAHYGDPVKLDLMRRMKAALDPAGIMNPGAVL